MQLQSNTLMINRNTVEVKLFKTTLLLAERDAIDVLNSIELAKENQFKNSVVSAFYETAKVVSDSLKYNLRILKPYQIFKRIKIKRIIKIKYLLSHLSQSELKELRDKVYYECEKLKREDDVEKKKHQGLAEK